MKYYLAFLLTLLASGCADVTNKMEEEFEHTIARLKPPVVEVKPVDREELRNDLLRGVADKIDNSVMQSENRQQGALNLATGQLNTKLTGAEITAKANLDTEVNAIKGDITGVKATLNTQVTASAVAEAKLDSVITVNSKLEAQLNVALTQVNQLKLDNVEMKAQAQVSANVQAGIANQYKQQIEDLKIQAGGNVNMFPANAVYTVLGVCGFMFIVVLVMVIMSNRSERIRFKEQTELTLSAAKLNAEEEREERQSSNAMLLEVLAMLPATEASKMSNKISRLFKRPAEGDTAGT